MHERQVEALVWAYRIIAQLAKNGDPTAVLWMGLFGEGVKQAYKEQLQ